MDGRSIVIYDGVCNLCNSSVRFLLNIDKKNELYFSHLQSDFAKKNLLNIEMDYLNFDSVVFLKNNKPYVKSRALFEIFEVVGYPWKIISFLKFLPTKISDAIYDFIASNRYKWFGKRDECIIPSDKLLRRFLS